MIVQNTPNIWRHEVIIQNLDRGRTNNTTNRIILWTKPTQALLISHLTHIILRKKKYFLRHLKTFSKDIRQYLLIAVLDLVFITVQNRLVLKRKLILSDLRNKLKTKETINQVLDIMTTRLDISILNQLRHNGVLIKIRTNHIVMITRILQAQDTIKIIRIFVKIWNKPLLAWN